MDDTHLKYLTNVLHNDRELLRGLVSLLVAKEIINLGELCDEILRMRALMEQEQARVNNE